ncbi:MAG: DUF937 domain-containing protein [Pseudarcicella sp.]|nr:DUF937 domain-containing protein [Pseudarcicella sp.]
MNLLGLLKNSITPELVSKAANLIGEDSNSTSSALTSVLPVLMGGLATKASTQSGASSLLGLINSGGHDGGILDNLGGLLGGGNASSGLMSAGSGIVSSIFGDKVGGIVSLLSGFLGMKGSSVTSLMSLAAPMVMGIVGKQVKTNGLDAGGLMSLFSGQKDAIASAMPAGLSDKMGGLLGFASSASGAASKVTNAIEETSEGGLPKWLLPVIIGLGAIGGLLYFMKGCNSKTPDTGAVTEMIDSTSTAVGESVDSLATATVEGAKKMFNVSLPDGVTFDVPEGSLEDQIVKFIQDDKAAIDKSKWFNFDRLLFETGKSTLTAESNEQIDKTVSILKAFPKVKIKIGGYTDNVGNSASNQKLSADRAATVMNAIVAGGIDKARLTSEGYGDQHPVGDNTTEEGRAQNRRIAISVREK